MKGVFLVLVFIGSFLFSFAQMNNPKKQLEAANLKLDEYDYRGALSIYESLLNDQYNTDEVFLNAGFCHLKLGHYDKAIDYYDTVLKTYEKQDNLGAPMAQNAMYNLAWAYFYTYDFENAKKQFQKLYEFSNKKQKKLLDRDIKICDSAEYYVNNPKGMFVYKPAMINSDYPDYSPIVSASNDVLYFTSRRPESYGKIQNDGFKCEDIYYAKISDGEFGAPQNIGSTINTDNHEATSSISPDGKTLFIYKWNDNKRGDIFVSHYENGEWQAIERLPKPINRNSNEVDACISPDNKIIIFSSDRRGGEGGKDLYLAKLTENGKWKSVKNLKTLNTEGDEIGPVFSPDGKYLYFSTNGRFGVGNFDIYKVKVNSDGTFGTPQNLGFPVNTVEDDIYYYPTTDPSVAYYSSKQEGIPNIYIVELYELNDNAIFVKGYTFDSNIDTLNSAKTVNDSVILGNNVFPLNKKIYASNDTVHIYSAKAEFVIDSVCKIPDNTTITVYNIKQNTSEKGNPPSDKGLYGIVLDKGPYLLKYSAPNHIYDIFELDGNKKVYVYNAELDTMITGQIKSRKITHFTKPDQLDDFQKKEFDVLSDFMQENPNLVVDISAWSKNSGPENNDETQQNLIINYLTDKGVEPDRIFKNLSDENPDDNDVFYTIYDTISVKKDMPVTPATPASPQIFAKVVSDINFDLNKYQNPNAYKDLDILAQFLIDNPEAKIEIAGYTDMQGNPQYNQRLSEKRALFVKNYLISKGAKPEQIIAEGKGFSKQISVNKDNNGNYIWNSLPYNRRVEINVLNQGDKYKILVNKIDVPDKYALPGSKAKYSIELEKASERIPLYKFKISVREIQWLDGFYSYLYGEYDSKNAAENDLESLKSDYPDAKVVKINFRE